MAKPPFGIRADFKAIKRQFIDRKNIYDAIDRASKRPLARFGGFVRSVARRSMRTGGNRPRPASQYPDNLKQWRRDGAEFSPAPRRRSKPGKPPLSHSRGLKDRIYFVVDVPRRSVIIGPQIFGGSDVPAALEFGEDVTIEKQWVSFWADGQRRVRLARKGRRRVKIKARPFMGPAYDAAVDRLLPDIWKDSL